MMNINKDNKSDFRYLNITEEKNNKVIKYIDYQPPKLRKLHKVQFFLSVVVLIIAGIVLTIMFSNDSKLVLYIWITVILSLVGGIVTYLRWKWKYDDNSNDS